MSQDQVYLVVTSAFTLGGGIAMPGDLVQVTDSEARNYLGRGMARPATEADGVPVPQANGDEAPEGDAKPADAEAPAAVTEKPAKAKK